MIDVDAAAQKFWPRWRGPSGQGIAADAGYVDTWSDKENVLWRARVPGRGHSSPIVWDDRIFLTTAYTRRARGDRRVPALRRPPALGSGRARPDAREPAPEEQPRVGHGDDRRLARVRVLREQGRDGRRLRAAACSGIARLADSTTTTAPPARRCSTRIGSFSFRITRAGGFVTALRRGRRAPALAHDRARHGRLEHAGRLHAVDHDEIVVSSQAACTPTIPRPGATLELRAATLYRGDSHAGRRPRPRVLLVGPRGPDAGHQARRQGRRHAARTSPGRARGDHRSSRRRSCTAIFSTSSTTWPASPRRSTRPPGS